MFHDDRKIGKLAIDNRQSCDSSNEDYNCRSDGHGLICLCSAMIKPDPYLARIEAFNLMNGGGVTITKVRNGYNLYLAATDTPIARLQPTGSDDEMRTSFWSYRERWQDVGDFGGIILPPEQALEEIATNGIFWTWT